MKSGSHNWPRAAAGERSRGISLPTTGPASAGAGGLSELAGEGSASGPGTVARVRARGALTTAISGSTPATATASDTLAPTPEPAGRSVEMGLEAHALYMAARDSLDEGHNWTQQVRVSVVLPALNEAENLPHVLPRIPAWVDEVLLVDGGSVDGTVDVARSLLPGIRILGQERPGKGAALRAGFQAATGDIIVTLDADGSTDPAELPAFIGCLLAGADFVKGSRFLQGGGTDDMGVVRKAGNWALRSAVRTAFGGRYSDLCYGYNAFWRRILPMLEGDADGFEIETLMNVRALAAGMRVVEVPSFEGRRVHGVSNLNTWRDGARVLRTIARERRYLRDGRRGAPRTRLVPVPPIFEVLLPLQPNVPGDDAAVATLPVGPNGATIDAHG